MLTCCASYCGSHKGLLITPYTINILHKTLFSSFTIISCFTLFFASFPPTGRPPLSSPPPPPPPPSPPPANTITTTTTCLSLSPYVHPSYSKQPHIS
ncbi:hypothetical protein QVD17_38563 [Tagetes erecta]|uniref:Uncharacterized protein n=1 Tax=Tagetes erecta TaxID=13708 RepID=A0AAD8NGC6_TARER|nr:hypothetical protein QVD17_38563 [Tagetes erecta]